MHNITNCSDPCLCYPLIRLGMLVDTRPSVTFIVIVILIDNTNSAHFLSAETRTVLYIAIVEMMSRSLQLFLVSIVLLTCVDIGAAQDDGESF